MDKVSDEVLDTSLRDLGGLLLRGLKTITVDLGLSIDIGVKGKHIRVGSDKETDGEDT
jgi:hypothetical protein